MNILRELENYAEVCSVLANQVKCTRCKHNILGGAFTLPYVEDTLVCDLCLRTDERGLSVKCTDVETCTRFGIYIFGDAQTSVHRIMVFLSQGTALLSVDPHNQEVSKKMFTTGDIMSVNNALTKFLEWNRIRKETQAEIQKTGIQPWALGAMWKEEKKEYDVKDPKRKSRWGPPREAPEDDDDEEKTTPVDFSFMLKSSSMPPLKKKQKKDAI